MKEKDWDYIAKVEKAISKKYGKETVQNPKASWDEEKEKEYIRKYYGLTKIDSEELLEELAFKLGKLHKGNIPDIELAARALLKDWQRGKIKRT